jgi:phosphomannomutase
MIAAELAAHMKAEGTTLLARLEAIYREHGLYVSSQVNVTRKGAEGQKQIAALMDGLRAKPPSKVGALEVVAVSDYQAQARTAAGGATTKLALPKSNVLAFELAGGSRVIARPSGTEPKCKFYFDVCAPVGRGERMADADARAQASMRALSEAFVAIAGV